MKIQYIDELLDCMKKYNIHKEDVCIVGSSVLCKRGIRENGDLDIALITENREKLFQYEDIEVLISGTMNLSEHVQILVNRYRTLGIKDEDIFEKKLYDDYDGFKIATFEMEVACKIKKNRRKDLIDLDNITLGSNFDFKAFDEFMSYKYVESKEKTSSSESRRTVSKKLLMQSMDDQVSILSVSKIETVALYALQDKQNKCMLSDLLCIFSEYRKSGDKSLYKKLRKYGIVSNTRFEAFYYPEEELVHDKTLMTMIHIDEKGNITDTISLAWLAYALIYEVQYMRYRYHTDYSKFMKSNYDINDYREVEREEYPNIENLELRAGKYFVAVLWGAVQNLFADIEKIFDEKYTIKNSFTLSFSQSEKYAGFIRGLYELDDAAEWKIQYKIYMLLKYASIVRIIIFDSDELKFRYKDRGHTFLSDTLATEKKNIREAFSNEEIGSDSVIHITDNYDINRKTIEVIRQYTNKLDI